MRKRPAPSPKPTAAAPPVSTSPDTAAIPAADRPLIKSAYGKLTQSLPLTREEKAAMARFEKNKEERLRQQYYRSIPQKHWRQMSGRQAKVLIEQAERYGIPFGDAVIDLPRVVRSLHDFLADNALKLARDDGDALLGGPASPALERYREERAALARLDRLEREGALLPRDEARLVLGRIAAVIRTAGETLTRQFGEEAGNILLEALADAEREIDRRFGSAKPAGEGEAGKAEQTGGGDE